MLCAQGRCAKGQPLLSALSHLFAGSAIQKRTTCQLNDPHPEAEQQ
jgi:hypothetical protein